MAGEPFSPHLDLQLGDERISDQTRNLALATSPSLALTPPGRARCRRAGSELLEGVADRHSPCQSLPRASSQQALRRKAGSVQLSGSVKTIKLNWRKERSRLERLDVARGS